MEERRIDRSRFKDQALQSWLDAVAQRNSVEGIVVGDSTGLLIAAGIAGEAAEEMAVAAASQANPSQQEMLVVGEKGSSLFILGMTFEEQLLYVCTKGEQADSKAALEEAIEGINRILTKP